MPDLLGDDREDEVRVDDQVGERRGGLVVVSGSGGPVAPADAVRCRQV
jgi:hypothetical protein